VDKSQFELLAPGGDLESIKAAIVAGADAVYCGLDRFNARNRAENLSLENLNDVIHLAHEHDCKIFLTLNIIILENEIPAITRLLRQLVNTKVDGVIVQDLGLAYILKHHFPALDVHGSTQLNTHNEGQILFLNQLGVSRVNLSRELNINEIKHLAQFGLKHNVLMEVFVHGSYCIGFSGLCYISSVRSGASGNRGRCSQPCRDQFKPTEVGSEYPLNMKDNSAFGDLKELAEAGVYSLKVEGRIKKSHYVYTVVDNWRRQIDAYCNNDEMLTDMTDLYTVFNRDFSNGYLKADIHQDMFTDNPRDHSAKHFTTITGCTSVEEIQKVKQDLYDKKTKIIQLVEEKTQHLMSEEKTNKIVSLKSGGVKDIPPLATHTPFEETAGVTVLIASPEQINRVRHSNATVYYRLPSNMDRSLDELVALFTEHSFLIPWFPAILIEKDYNAVAQFLEQVKPTSLVANNTGVGFLAKQNGISWIAGPELNVTNSFAIKCLQEEFDCSGAFISNELSMFQMRKIVRPEGFKLLHSIYHPITLMTSRQCFFQQSSGCKKMRINKGCLPKCEKHTAIISLKDKPYIVDKKKGNYNNLYAEHNFLNTKVITDLPEFYTDFMLDLSPIETMTKVSVGEAELVDLFTSAINGNESSLSAISEHVHPTVNNQYKKGL